MSNLTANEMFQETGAGEHTVQEILAGVERLKNQAEHLILVTNEIFSDGIEYDKETRTYQDYLGKINQNLAREADQVTEVVYGIPVHWKQKEGQNDETAME